MSNRISEAHYVSGNLLAAWEGLRHLAIVPHAHVERVERFCLLQIDERVVSSGENRGHVVAPMLSARIVDDANGAMSSWLSELGCFVGAVFGENEERITDSGVLHRVLVTPFARVRNIHAL